MVRFRNRIIGMPDDRLPRIICKWDRSLKTDAWARSMDFVLQEVNILETEEESFVSVSDIDDSLCDMCYIDTERVKKKLLQSNRDKWWVAAAEMPKLRTFVELYDFHDPRGLVYTHLTRRQRSLVTKFKIGIMSLSIEKGRYTNVPLENRLCHICNEGLLEDEYHFILYCEALKDIRSNHFACHTYLEDVSDPTDKTELCRLMLNSHNLKNTARFIEDMFDSRLRKLYV